MSAKRHLKSLSYFSLAESCSVVIGMMARKIAGQVSSYNLFAKTRFDFYQERGIGIKKNKQQNTLSFTSSFSGKRLEFSIRRKTTDIVIFDEVMLGASYSPVLKICELLSLEPRVIIDAGANVGSSAVFFKDVFPDAKLICIEPEHQNQLMLKKNMALNRFTDVVFIEGGLWDKDEVLEIQNGFRGSREKELSFSLAERQSNDSTSNTIKGYTLETILNDHHLQHADILKIDIEGAEARLFRSFEQTAKLLGLTKILAIELHDECIDRFVFTQMVEQAGYHQITFGEVTYIYKPLQ